MTATGGMPPRDPGEVLIARLRAAAHAAVDAGDGAVAVTLARLIEERARATERRAEVTSLDAARRRRRSRGK